MNSAWSLQPLLLGLLLLLPGRLSAYPVTLHVEEDDKRCLQFNIPEDDDAHVVMLALPHEDHIDDEAVEAWYIEQVYKMTKLKNEKDSIPRTFTEDPPSNVAKTMSDFLKEEGGNVSPIRITMNVESYDEQKYSTNYNAKYFVPIVLNHVRQHHAKQLAENFEGVNICFENADEDDPVQVVFDMILTSEEVVDHDELDNAAKRFDKEKHLNPLESSLDHSIQAAHAILREMKYMENREKRMRRTADSINRRVRVFSYLSVGVLLAVTYIQVTYLKRYFHKKKLM